ncbi:dihydrofolate reductase [Methylobacterium sp. PvP062]|jgi:dihydrofolate reductase|uniref:Dihydrofolate reductase n=2 Tax=Methylobacterium radiotolerans TaxID=31998 RepID=B1M531_METRJ|nr:MULTISPECIES: dihydrofolate reductase [Methylobacterium]MCX7331780.1 dihydrofolate reductase [Hyphomicrobiales bacterium]GAN48516.1 dihydrofolate reductase [Methylobacterium sp. ME121]ACB26492.1 Dihydrofolate reductase [Methylobacterium radiotolerans JCM 2831]KTS08115.1 diacylglycerol kinase [Methylobacterium radiotolerans]KTS51020.1 diacylglycerol kinase [Methylobacterium radiotolerans]
MSATVAPLVSLVAAVARNGVIGRDNGLAWHLSSDLKRFKALTMGKPMLMGRRTWDSIGRPLPGRRTLVLTRDTGFRAEGVETVHDWDSALAAAGAELMVVGGAEIYALALPHADRLHLTEVEAEPAGDVRFPAFDRARFRETFREAHPAGPRDEHAFAFVDWERAR